MMGLLLKFLIGVLIVPVGYGVTVGFYRNFMMIPEVGASQAFFAWGILSYAILHLLFYKPTPAYVFGHEAVHALVAWFFGAKIQSFKVSAEGGSVTTDKSNFIIELSPYFIPVYSIVIAVIYFVVSSSYKIDGRLFLFLIGASLAFHLISTTEILKVRQPDIVKSGYFFSIVFVYTLNIIVVAMIFALVFPSFSIKAFFTDFLGVSKGIYFGIIKQLFNA